MLKRLRLLLNSCHWSKQTLTTFLTDAGPEFLHQRAMEELTKVSYRPGYSTDDVEKVKMAIKLLNLAMLKSIEINGAKA